MTKRWDYAIKYGTPDDHEYLLSRHTGIKTVITVNGVPFGPYDDEYAAAIAGGIKSSLASSGVAKIELTPLDGGRRTLAVVTSMDQISFVPIGPTLH